MDIDRDQYEELLEVADSFLDKSKDVGTAELGEALEDIFGSQYLSDPLAEPFRSYFAAVQTYEEDCRDERTDPVPVRPSVRTLPLFLDVF